MCENTVQKNSKYGHFLTQRNMILRKIFYVEYLAEYIHTIQYKENIYVRREKSHKGRIGIKKATKFCFLS